MRETAHSLSQISSNIGDNFLSVVILFQACESLELGVLGSHLFRRQMRHVEDNNTLMKATVVSSSISGLLLRLRFFVRDLLRKSQVTSTKRTALIELKLRMESCLREYLLEASKGAKIPVLTTV